MFKITPKNEIQEKKDTTTTTIIKKRSTNNTQRSKYKTQDYENQNPTTKQDSNKKTRSNNETQRLRSKAQKPKKCRNKKHYRKQTSKYKIKILTYRTQDPTKNEINKNARSKKRDPKIWSKARDSIKTHDPKNKSNLKNYIRNTCKNRYVKINIERK